jgi:hypothetical protein
MFARVESNKAKEKSFGLAFVRPFIVTHIGI